MNSLYYGDNLDILKKHIKDETVDLIYLDPPFQSGKNYNQIFQPQAGGVKGVTSQIQAFEDTWHWGEEAEREYTELITGTLTIEPPSQKLIDLMKAMRGYLTESPLLAYLCMMAPRLVEMRRALKETGSIYLHCDPTASHYLKLLLDAIFENQFRNEIVWRRTGAHNSSKRYGPIHDILLFYTKSDRYFFKKTYGPYTNGHVDDYFKKKDNRGRYWTNALTGKGTRKGNSGNPWKGYNPTAGGRHWAIPSRISDELGLDEDMSTQEKLDAFSDAGFIQFPPSGSAAMPMYLQYLETSPGIPIQDIWAYQPHTNGVLHGTDECIDEDVRWLVAHGDTERLGYPTQKTEGLLKRIIGSSCPEKGLVLDPFCGCGTTIAAAVSLGRQWIGIDITYLAIDVIKKRL